MFPLLETIAKLASSQFNRDLPPAIDSIKRDPIKGILSTAYDIAAPVTVQAALYSPEAEAAFIGPQGMKRLQAAGMGDRVKEFTSRFFGQRGEINPTDTDLVIQSMMGGPHSIAKAKTGEWDVWRRAKEELSSRAKEFPKSLGLQEALAKHSKNKPEQLVVADFLEHFPELITAYPRLKQVPVNFYDSNIGVRYSGKYDPEATIRNTTALSSVGAGRKAEDAFYAAMGEERYMAPSDISRRGRKVASMERKRARLKEQGDKRTGDITIVGQENASIPGLDSYNTLLHEIQHFIQREEAGLGRKPGAEFLDLYHSQAKTQPYNYDTLIDKVGERKDAVERDAIAVSEKAGKAYNSFDSTKLYDAIVSLVKKGKLTEEQAEKVAEMESTRKAISSGGEFNTFLSEVMYNKANSVQNKLKSDDLPMHSKSWDYKMNPFEREAYESARRDTDPGYRNSFTRKTEQLKQQG